jgi:hypothetical protein
MKRVPHVTRMCHNFRQLQAAKPRPWLVVSLSPRHFAGTLATSLRLPGYRSIDSERAAI